MNDVLAAFTAEVMHLTTQYQRHNGEPNTVELFC